MKKSFVTTSLLSFLAVGCAKPAVMAPRAEAPAPPATEMVEPETAHAEPIEVALPADPFNFVKAKKGWGEPGDYVVYRFTGSYRKTPLQMTRTVVGRRGGNLIVDVTLTEGGASERLRVFASDRDADRGRVVSVARIEGPAHSPHLVPYGVAAYQKRMSEAVLSADENQAMTAQRGDVIPFGRGYMDVQRTSFRVRVGDKQATMHTLSSEAFPWGDLGGEIRANGGEILYRAQVIDASAKSGAAIAAHEDMDVYDVDRELE